MRYLLDVKGNKPGSVEDVMYRLGVFFAEVDERGKVVRDLADETLGSITPAKGDRSSATSRLRRRPRAMRSARRLRARSRNGRSRCSPEGG